MKPKISKREPSFPSTIETTDFYRRHPPNWNSIYGRTEQWTLLP